jgi:hypothetical protein
METRGYDWVCRTIETCSNIFQLETAEKLLENFRKISKNDHEIMQMLVKFRMKADQLNYYDYKYKA